MRTQSWYIVRIIVFRLPGLSIYCLLVRRVNTEIRRNRRLETPEISEISTQDRKPFVETARRIAGVLQPR